MAVSVCIIAFASRKINFIRPGNKKNPKAENAITFSPDIV